MTSNVDEVVNSLVEIVLKNPEDFLKVKETLTRIGVAVKRDNTLYQSCHILHKRGKYYIVHFKELFMLDGKDSTFTDDDKARRNVIINLLEEWELVSIENSSRNKASDPVADISSVKIIGFKDKDKWNLVPKYSIGGKK